MDTNEAIEKAMKYWVYRKSRMFKLIEDGEIPSEKVRDDEVQTEIYKHHAETPDGKKSITTFQQASTEMRTIKESLELTPGEFEAWRNKDFDPKEAPEPLIRAAISFAVKFDDGAIIDLKEWKSIVPDLPITEGKQLAGNLFEIPCSHCSKIILVNITDKFVICPECGKENILLSSTKV